MQWVKYLNLNIILNDKETLAIDVEIDLSKVNVEVDDDEHTNNIVIDEKRNLGIVLIISLVK